MKSALLGPAFLLAFATPLSAADPAPGEFVFSADVRAGHFSREREDRDGRRSDDSDWRIRVRPGVLWQVTPELSAKARFAGRYSTDDSNHNHYQFFTAIPQSDGLGFGDSTIDVLYLRYNINRRQLLGSKQLRPGACCLCFWLTCPLAKPAPPPFFSLASATTTSAAESFLRSPSRRP
jgi:hypothetical protein